MMVGRGSGYKNVVGRDPAVHSQSAKGIKQPQKVNMIVPKIDNELNWVKNEGWESPSWYNIKFLNKSLGQEIILSNDDGTPNANEKWFAGIYDSDGQPIGINKEFNSKEEALKWVKNYQKEKSIYANDLQEQVGAWKQDISLKSGTFQFTKQGDYYYNKLGAWKHPNGKWFLEDSAFKKTKAGSELESDIIIGKFDTREQAVKEAIKYMKTFP